MTYTYGPLDLRLETHRGASLGHTVVNGAWAGGTPLGRGEKLGPWRVIDSLRLANGGIRYGIDDPAADRLAYCASMAAARESITPAEWRRAERAFTSSGSPRLA